LWGGIPSTGTEKQKTHPEGCVFHHVMQNLSVTSYEDTCYYSFLNNKQIAFKPMQEATGALTQLSSQRLHKRLCYLPYITFLLFCQGGKRQGEVDN
jgi:hypothetical protein